MYWLTAASLLFAVGSKAAPLESLASAVLNDDFGYWIANISTRHSVSGHSATVVSAEYSLVQGTILSWEKRVDLANVTIIRSDENFNCQVRWPVNPDIAIQWKTTLSGKFVQLTGYSSAVLDCGGDGYSCRGSMRVDAMLANEEDNKSVGTVAS